MIGTIAVFGASGRTGRRVLEAAARSGLGVRASTRREGSSAAGDGAIEIRGSVLDAGHVGQALDGTDGACLVFGPRPPCTDLFCGDATALIVREMERAGIVRLICLTGAMVGDFPENRRLVFERMARVWQGREPEAHRDRVEQERVVRSSGLDWLIVKPPRLREGRRSGIVAGSRVRVGLTSSISRSDLAEFIVGQFLDPSLRKETVFVRAG